MHVPLVPVSAHHRSAPRRAAKQDVVVSSGAPTSIEDDFTRPAGVGGLGVTSDGNASWMVVSGSILYDEAGPFAHAVVPDSIMVVDAGTSEGTLEFEGSCRLGRQRAAQHVPCAPLLQVHPSLLRLAPSNGKAPIFFRWVPFPLSLRSSAATVGCV